jgi:hypothetical protein
MKVSSFLFPRIFGTAAIPASVSFQVPTLIHPGSVCNPKYLMLNSLASGSASRAQVQTL